MHTTILESAHWRHVAPGFHYLKVMRFNVLNITDSSRGITRMRRLPSLSNIYWQFAVPVPRMKYHALVTLIFSRMQ